MGHDTHFLSRLTRVSDGDVELAMSLYRDPGLVRAVLERAGLPDGAERAALALGSVESGPYVVLQRNGHFVTCLGEGMSVGDLPIISRAKLDAVASRLERLREQLAIAAKVAPDERRESRLAKRLFEAGPRLSREEFVAHLAWMALVAKDHLLQVLELRKRARSESGLMMRRDYGDPDWREMAARHVQGEWAIGHLLALLLADGGHRDVLDRIVADSPADIADYFTLTAHRHDFNAVALRAFHGIGRVGKPMLAEYKRLLAEEPRREIEAIVALGAMAHAHPKLAAEIRKHATRADAAQLLIDDDDEIREWVYGIGRERAVRQLHDENGPVFERQEDVPDDLALTMLGYAFRQPEDMKAFTEEVVAPLVYLAKVPAETMYLPETWAKKLRLPDDEKVGIWLGQRLREEAVPKPVTREATPGRNDPCSCGSGRKYKKCCGK